MKRLLVITVLSGAVTAYSQITTPQVDFNNHRSYAIPADRDVYGQGGVPLVGTQYLAQLYYGADAGSLQPVTAAPARFRDPAEIAMNPVLAGTWRGGTRALTGFNAGSVVTLQVRAWDSTGGETYDTALWKGESATFTYTIPSASTVPAAQYLENLRSFTLVPEPSVIGLSVIAAGVLLIHCRRRL